MRCATGRPGEAQRVQDEPLAVVEAEPQRPVLPRQRVAVERERDALGLGDLDRLAGRRAAQVGHEARDVLAHHPGRLLDRERVLDLQQLHRVQVDDAVQPVDRVRVRIGARGGAIPRVRPADPAARVLLRHEEAAVAPDVDQDEVMSVIPRAASASISARLAPQRLVALVPLVGRQVRLDAASSSQDTTASAPATRPRGRPRRRRGSSTPRSPRARRRRPLRRLLELDRREAPALADTVVAPQDRGRLAELVRGKGIEVVHQRIFTGG